MNLITVGQQIAARRRHGRLTLSELAAAARVGRSTLAALEAGKLAELGFERVARLCQGVGLILEVRATALDAPLMAHRHLTDAAARDLTKAAIADVITRGNIAAWRGLVRAMRAEEGGRVARRTREVVAHLDQEDVRVRTFASLLPELLRRPRCAPKEHA